MVFIERHIFLLLACIALLFSGLCYVLLEQDAPGATDEQYVVALQERIRQETRVSAAELKQLATKLASTPSYAFGTLEQKTQYPYYIFRNKKLLYWSDNRFIPDYARIANIPFTRLIDFDQGRFIVSRTKTFHKRDTLEIFSLINVYRQYNNTNTYLQSGYNPALFSVDPQSVTTQKGPSHQNIYDATPVFLFSVIPPKVDPYRNHTTPVNTVILATLGVLLLGIYVIRQISRSARRRRYETGFLWLAGYLLLLRGLMLYVGVPYLFIENDLFNAKHYASSELSPSLGDLMLNGVALVILAFYIANNYFRSRTYRRLLHLSPLVQRLLSVGCVVLSYTVFFFSFTQLNDLYEKSQYTLDLSLSIEFPPLKVACLLFFVILSLLYFLTQHTLVSLFTRFNADNRWLGVGLFMAGSGLAVGICWLLNLSVEWVYALNGAYFLALYLSRFPRYLYTFQYKTSLYLFLGALICAATAANVVYEQSIRKDWLAKKTLGKQLLAENDEYGELLLYKAHEGIQNDLSIRQVLHPDSALRREKIQQRIKSRYLDRYLDKYDTEVISFDAQGNSLDVSINATPLSDYLSRFQQSRYKTIYEDLYFVNEVGNHFNKEYVSFVPIRNNAGAVAGYVVLDLKLRPITPGNVYRELLVDSKTIQSPDVREYSYAFFEKAGRTATPRLVESTGSYNYERKLPVSLLNNSALYDRGVTVERTSHLGIQGSNGRILVVSSAAYPLSTVLANLSFLYLILVLSVILVIILYAVQYGLSRFSINYSTRIQILLNVAFFLPLVLVVVIILGVISANYVANQETNYITNTKNIAAKVWTYLDENLKGIRSKEAMEEELQSIARDADIDINLFDTAGRLYTSTQMLIYESGNLSKYINPQAFIHIAEDKENQKLLYEQLGTKQYSTAYVGVKSPDGRLLGIMSVPYFYAQPELDKQLLEVVSSALSVFTTLFVVFLVLSYFAAGSLTRPLKMLTQRIRRTSLDQLNQQKIEWKSDDELGLLIQEYNRMLSKLEESKVSLAQSEKQSAWREMAKQVAHEIKNPLTPMKLTLQQLQRTLPGMNPITDRAVSRTLDSLLEQIDNISDIATSFSDFANMPMPQNELVELSAVLHKAADLFADDRRVTIRRHIDAGPVWVIGDRQLLMRIINNLIINGIQSVSQDTQPVIDLRLFAHDGNANIEVHDNGDGIPEPIRPKVFLPNFSTKQGGTGIGLALSKRGIEHAGGNIWFETTVGVGTSFFIDMPLASPAPVLVAVKQKG
ncbi:ATP-binding protein [Fibrella sp. WM1]|uniref:sensor histidine kinase n=1 Tax=Fibrella musci TaxID=3242485 RepID=UPI0035206D4C